MKYFYQQWIGSTPSSRASINFKTSKRTVIEEKNLKQLKPTGRGGNKSAIPEGRKLNNKIFNGILNGGAKSKSLDAKVRAWSKYALVCPHGYFNAPFCTVIYII
jgi:hypothetical protein